MSVTFSAFNTATDSFVGEGVNFANGNALTVLDALGVVAQPGEEVWDVLAGELPVRDFQGRVLVALGVLPVDEGTPDVVLTQAEKEAGGDLLTLLANATVVSCGRRPGYLQERIGELRGLAEQAVAAGCDVISWA